MLPIEPRLKPLGATIIHYSDSEAKAKFTRCHSFSGYVPYFLETDSQETTVPSSQCSGGATPETHVGEASPVPHVWPDTDEEGPDPCTHQSAPSESGESDGKTRGLTTTVWPTWGEEGYDQLTDPSFVMGPWGLSETSYEAYPWEMWPERPTPIGERVIEGFGKALRKAVGEAPTAKVHTCFHSNETTDIEEYIWHLYRHAGCRSVCFVYAFVYICRMSELNAGQVELSPRTCHRLLLAAITIAAKQQNLSFDAKVYAAAGKVTVEELENLEDKLKELLQWNLDVCAKSFKRIFRLLSQAA